MRIRILLLVILLGLLGSSHAQSLNDKWFNAWGTCRNAPCLNLQAVQSTGPWTGGGTLQDRLFNAFGTCNGLPCLTVTDATGALPISVKAYGATGDGVTDDTEKIQAALDAAAPTQGTVIVPSTTASYKTTATLLIGDGVSLIGDSERQSIISYTGTGSAISSSNITARHYYVNIRDLTITTSTGTTGLDFTNMSSAEVTHTIITGFTNAVLVKTSGVGNASLYNRFYDVYAKNGVNGWQIIGVYAISGANATIINASKAAGFTGTGIYIEDSNDITVSDTQIETGGGVGTGIRVVASNTNYSEGIRLIGLRIEGLATGINIDSNTRDVAIIQPYFSGNTANFAAGNVTAALKLDAKTGVGVGTLTPDSTLSVLEPGSSSTNVLRLHGDGWENIENPLGVGLGWNTHHNGTNRVARVTNPGGDINIDSSGDFVVRTFPSTAAGGTITLTPRLRVRNTGTIIVGAGEASGSLTGTTVRGPDGSGTNVAGVDTMIRPSLGTGTGTLGSLTFSTAEVVQGSGSTAHTAVNNMRLVAGHVEFSGTAPTVGSGAGDCGTAPSITGNDKAGIVTVGSGANGGKCTVTFKASWTNAPHCFVNDRTTAIVTRAVNTSTTAVELTGVFVAGDVVDYYCVGHF